MESTPKLVPGKPVNGTNESIPVATQARTLRLKERKGPREQANGDVEELYHRLAENCGYRFRL